MNLHILTILGCINRPVTTNDILELLVMTGYKEEFSTHNSLQVVTYRALSDFVKRQYVKRLHNSQRKKIPYRYEISEQGLNYLANHRSIFLINRLMEKLQ